MGTVERRFAMILCGLLALALLAPAVVLVRVAVEPPLYADDRDLEFDPPRCARVILLTLGGIHAAPALALVAWAAGRIAAHLRGEAPA